MPRHKEFNEQQTLQKAMQLFWKQGYHATSMQDLVDHLGISRASMYSTFGSKKELFNSALQLYRKLNTERVLEFLANYKEVKAGIYALFELGIQQSLTDKDKKGCFVVNTCTEMIPMDAEIQAKVLDNKQSFEQIFKNYLQQGVEQGQISKEKNLDALAAMLFTLYNGIKVLVKVETDVDKLLAPIKESLKLLDK